MPITVIIPSGEIINSQVNSNAGIERTKLATEQLKDNIPLELVRVWDAFQTSLPTTAASDDLGLIPGTWATDAIVIQTSDAKTRPSPSGHGLCTACLTTTLAASSSAPLLGPG